jgi:hypothetical protein
MRFKSHALKVHLATGTGWGTWTIALPAPMVRRVIWTGTPRLPENPEIGEEERKGKRTRTQFSDFQKGTGYCTPSTFDTFDGTNSNFSILKMMNRK